MASTRVCLVTLVVIVALALEAAAARQLSKAPLTSIQVYTRSDPSVSLYLCVILKGSRAFFSIRIFTFYKNCSLSFFYFQTAFASHLNHQC
jgi:hypothetical protein